MNTLTYGVTTLTLPEDLLWVDEFAWRRVEQRRSFSITGAQILESAAAQAGRPISLEGGDDYGWIDRDDLLTLDAWRQLPGQVFGLVVRGEASRNVVFNHEAGAIEAVPVVDYSDVDPGDHYRLKLRFLQV